MSYILRGNKDIWSKDLAGNAPSDIVAKVKAISQLGDDFIEYLELGDVELLNKLLQAPKQGFDNLLTHLDDAAEAGPWLKKFGADVIELVADKGADGVKLSRMSDRLHQLTNGKLASLPKSYKEFIDAVPNPDHLNRVGGDSDKTFSYAFGDNGWFTPKSFASGTKHLELEKYLEELDEFITKYQIKDKYGELWQFPRASGDVGSGTPRAYFSTHSEVQSMMHAINNKAKTIMIKHNHFKTCPTCESFAKAVARATGSRIMISDMFTDGRRLIIEPESWRIELGIDKD